MNLKLLFYNFLLIFFLFFPAESFCYQQIEIGKGARASSMGMAYTAISDDSSGIYWNPAGLAFAKRNQASFSFNKWFLDSSYKSIEAVFGLWNGFFGVSLSHIDMGVFDYIDDEGYLTGETITPYTTGFILSYGTQVLAFYDDFSTKPMYKFSTGVSIKGYYDNDGYDARAFFLMDAGSVFMLTDVISIGISFKNLNIAAEAVIPPSLNVGLASTVFTDGVNSLKLSADAHFWMDNTKELCFGGEYSFSEYFFLRMGYLFMPDYMTSEGSVSGLNGGLGVRVQDFRLDYALTTHGGLGINHAITLLYYFAV